MPKINKKGKIILSVIAFLLVTPLTIFYVLDGAGVFDTRSRAGEENVLPEKFKPADLNADNKISIADFSIWLSNFRQFKVNPTAFSDMSDLNDDGAIAIADFVIWLGLWREYKALNTPVVPPVTPPVADLTTLGTGADGDITVNSDVNISTSSMAIGRSCADAKAYSVVRFDSNTVAVVNEGVDAACIKAGDEVLVIGLSGTGTNVETVGNYENFIVSSVAGDKVTFTTAKTKSFGSKIVLQRVPQYRDVNIVAGKTLSSSSWDGTTGGVIFFRATGTVNVEGIISVNGTGYRGGAAGILLNYKGGEGGEAFCGPVSVAGGQGGSGVAANVAGSAGTCGGGGGSGADDDTVAAGGLGSAVLGGAGGGGGSTEDATNAAYNHGGGGGGGGYGTFGYLGEAVDGNCDGKNGGTNLSGNGGKSRASSTSVHSGGGGGGGGTYGDVNLGRLFFGAGGGGGGKGEYYGTPGAGGNGGGVIYIAANTITVTGVISSNGANGVNGTGAKYDNSGGGGGGAGGSIKLVGNILNVGVGKTTANGGLGGAAGELTGGTNKGGDGGSGRIRIEYVTTFTGSTNPVSSNAKI